MLHEALIDSPISLEKTERALGEINQQIEQRLLEMANPIIVTPVPEGDVKYLVITNEGNTATFTAQIKLESDDINVSQLSKLSYYQALWDNSSGCKARILCGQSAKIKIAEVTSARPLMGLNMSIFFCQSSNSPASVRAEAMYFGAIQFNSDTGITSPLKNNHEYNLLVTISSDSELKGYVFRGRYKLGYDGLVLDSNHPPTSRKEGYRS